MLDVPLGFRDYAKADRQFYAGVDCTQRTAFARIVDGTCKPIQSNLCTGPLNPYVFDLDDVVDTIHGAVINTIKITTPRISPRDIVGIAVVMPSLGNRDNVRQTLENRILKKWLFGNLEAIVVHDLDLLMDDQGGNGLILSSGRRDREYGQTSGGLAYRAESSSFGNELADEAINTVIDSAKGHAPLTTLLPHFRLAFDVDRLDDLVARFDYYNEADRFSTVQEVLPILAEEARFGDSVSLGLCSATASRYADLANAGIRQLKLEQIEFPIGLVGDVWNIGAPVKIPFLDGLKSTAPKAFLAQPEYDLAELATFLAIERFGW